MRGRRRAFLVGGLLAGGAVAAAAAARARARQPGGDDRSSPVRGMTRAQRIAKTYGLGGRAGASYALHRARKVFASAERQQQLDEEFQLRTAAQVAEVLGGMKGALMKIGQMVSYLDSGVSAPVREALAGLQQDAPPMAPELAAEVVERELGAPPEQVFLEWDPRPIASASIGQVHRAITQDERAVAVKVQYPGVDDAIRADLDNARMMYGGLRALYPGLDPEGLIEEIRARVTEELDYRQEARNQQLFADHYRGHPFVHVPDVLPRWSTGRVLTTELAEGVRFDEMKSTWSQDERNLAAEAIYRFVFRSLYRLQAFNGDPHPGNYLFRPGGQVTFLDFGLVKYFTGPEIDVFARMIKAMVYERDVPRYRAIVEEAGLLKPGLPFADEDVQAYFGHFYEFVMDDAEVTVTPEWSSDTVERFFSHNSPHVPIVKAANLPPAFVIIQRINLGLMAILGELHATGNFRRIAEEMWPWVDGPPSTDMGKAEAAWLAEHHRN